MVGSGAVRKLICNANWTFSATTHHHFRDLAPLRAFGSCDIICMHPKPELFLWHSPFHTYHVHVHKHQDPQPGPFLRHNHFHTHAEARMHKHVSHPKAAPLLLLTHFHTHDVHMHGHEDPSATRPTHAAADAAAQPVHVRVSDEERKRLLKLVDEEDLKKCLLNTGLDFMPYVDFIKLCKDSSIAATNAEVEAIVRRLDNAGVILTFRNIIFLRPSKVAEMIASALPMSLAGEDDPRKEELRKLEKEKEEIDKAAQKQVQRMLWVTFGALSLQSLLFFRLTFWDLSWDVMEPITFFAASSTVLVGLLFFIFTHREPSYQDLMQTLFSLKQRKLMKKNKFDVERLKHLQMMQCALPLHE